MYIFFKLSYVNMVFASFLFLPLFPLSPPVSPLLLSLIHDLLFFNHYYYSHTHIHILYADIFVFIRVHKYNLLSTFSTAHMHVHLGMTM